MLQRGLVDPGAGHPGVDGPARPGGVDPGVARGVGPASRIAATPRRGDPRRAAARPLRARVWDLFEPHLDGCGTVIIIPDSGLTAMPWGALPGKTTGSFLIDDYAVGTALNGQHLVGLLKRPDPGGDGLLLVGGID